MKQEFILCLARLSGWFLRIHVTALLVLMEGRREGSEHEQMLLFTCGLGLASRAMKKLRDTLFTLKNARLHRKKTAQAGPDAYGRIRAGRW